MKSLSERAALLMLLNVFKYAIGFVVPVVLVRLLTQFDFGTYKQLLIVSSVTVGVMRLGIPTSIYFFYNNIPEKKKDIFVLQTVVLMILSGLFSAAVLYVASPYIAAAMGNELFYELLPLYAVYILFYIASDHLFHFLISQDRYYFSVYLQSGESILRAAILIIPLLLGYGIYGLILSVVVYSVIRYIVFTYILRGHLLAIKRKDLKDQFIVEQLKYSLPLAFTRLVSTLGSQFDKILISIYFTTEQFAVYAIGALEIPLDVIFQSSVSNVLRAKLPRLIKENKIDEVVVILRNSTRKLALVIWPISGCLFLLSHEFITILFTDNYADSVDIFRIYLIALPLNAFVLSPVPQVFGYTKFNMYVSFVAVSFNIVFSLVLINTIGYFGPAIATVSTWFLSSFLYLLISKKLTNKSIHDLLPFFDYFKIILTIVVSGFLTLFLLSYIYNDVVRIICGGFLYFVLIFLTGRLFNLYSQGDKKLILKTISKIPIVSRFISNKIT